MATNNWNYQDFNNDYGRTPRSREEYECMMHKKMMYEMQAQGLTKPAPEAPKKPASQNPKLLLTKGS